ncbi:COG1470 family protein [Streptomyces sp. NPDC054863]
MRRRLRLLIALLGWLGPLYAAGPAPAAMAAAAPAVAAPAADAWTAGPASGGGTRPDSGGRPYFYLQGAPGTVFEDKLSVTNPGREPRTVSLRAEDAEGAWIALAAAEVKVPPRTRADVPFTVTVPAGAQPGDHPGAIVASAPDGRAQRTAVQLRVSGPTLAALSVEDVRIGDGVIRYALVNRGNTTLVPHVAVRAEGLFGELLRRAPHPVGALAPGRRTEHAEPWPDTPALDRTAARLTVTADGGIREEGAATKTFVTWVPVLGGGAVLLTAVAGAALWTVRRRRSAHDEG